jgi:hypothetical protein
MLDDAPRMALFFADYSLGILGLRDGSWKFVYELGSGRSKIFDLDRDPLEKTGIAKHEASRAEWYGQIVRGWSGTEELSGPVESATRHTIARPAKSGPAGLFLERR